MEKEFFVVVPCCTSSPLKNVWKTVGYDMICVKCMTWNKTYTAKREMFGCIVMMSYRRRGDGSKKGETSF